MPVHQHAWTGGNTRGASAWFTVADGDRLTLSLAVPDGLGDRFDAMVREVTEYRLHRYLVGKKRLDMGERRLVRANGGAVLDAEFVVEMLDDRVTVVIESAGGTAGSDGARNTDYVAGLDLVLGRLVSIGVELVDAYVDSSVTAKLPVEARRLAASDWEFPVPSRVGRPVEVAPSVAASQSAEPTAPSSAATPGSASGWSSTAPTPTHYRSLTASPVARVRRPSQRVSPAAPDPTGSGTSIVLSFAWRRLLLQTPSGSSRCVTRRCC